jgi:hypothetical protein
MNDLGFTQSITDNAVYFKENCIAAVYGDDLLIMTKNEAIWVEIEKRADEFI